MIEVKCATDCEFINEIVALRDRIEDRLVHVSILRWGREDDEREDDLVVCATARTPGRTVVHEIHCGRVSCDGRDRRDRLVIEEAVRERARLRQLVEKAGFTVRAGAGDLIAPTDCRCATCAPMVEAMERPRAAQRAGGSGS